MLRPDVRQQNVLRGGQSHFRLEALDHAAQTGLELVASLVPNPAVLDEQSQKIIAVVLLMPAEHIVLPRKLERTRRLELDARALLDLSAKPIDASLVQNVFQSRVLPVAPIAKIPMNRQDSFGDGLQMLGMEETYDIGQARKGLRVAVRHPQSAAGQQVITYELSVFGNDHKAQVVGENIDVIRRRNRESGFELSRQIGFAIKRVHEVARFG